MTWILLLLGIPIGVIAARADVLILSAWNRARYGKLGLSGNWAEYVAGSEGRQFSIGTVSYDIFKRRYNFDGTNYSNDGRPFCHWVTISSHLDREAGVFHYIFTTTAVGAEQSRTYGYGFLSLVNRQGTLAPEDGYYIYTDGDKAISVGHTMKKIGSIPSSRGEPARELLESIFPDQMSPVSPTVTQAGADVPRTVSPAIGPDAEASTVSVPPEGDSAPRH